MDSKIETLKQLEVISVKYKKLHNFHYPAFQCRFPNGKTYEYKILLGGREKEYMWFHDERSGSDHSEKCPICGKPKYPDCDILRLNEEMLEVLMDKIVSLNLRTMFFFDKSCSL